MDRLGSADRLADLGLPEALGAILGSIAVSTKPVEAFEGRLVGLIGEALCELGEGLVRSRSTSYAMTGHKKRSRNRLAGGVVCQDVGAGRVDISDGLRGVDVAPRILKPLSRRGGVSINRFDQSLCEEVIEHAHVRLILGRLRTELSKAPSASSHSAGERTVTLIGRPTSASTAETAS